MASVFVLIFDEEAINVGTAPGPPPITLNVNVGGRRLTTARIYRLSGNPCDMAGPELGDTPAEAFSKAIAAALALPVPKTLDFFGMRVLDSDQRMRIIVMITNNEIGSALPLLSKMSITTFGEDDATSPTQYIADASMVNFATTLPQMIDLCTFLTARFPFPPAIGQTSIQDMQVIENGTRTRIAFAVQAF